jgi:hypothetical protein
MTKENNWLQNGDPTEEKCPKCGSTILYNGNYFCKNWNYPATENDCDWALPHPQTELVDKRICFKLVGYWEEGEKVINGESRWIVHREEPN